MSEGDFFGFYLFVWLCMGLIYISGLVLGLLSTVIALLGVAVLITYSPAEYLKTAEAIRKVPTSLYRVLEDGSLSKELRTEYLTGAKPPKFTGGVAKPGEEIVLETEDREYLKEGEIKAYLDKQSFTTEINSSSMEILEEERKMVISPKAFKGKAEGEHTLILVRDGYQTLELPLSFKEEAVEKLPEERLSPSNLSS